jgi:hypothetical protein
MNNSPWSNGPKEILKHGLDLIVKGSESRRRIAMILIDNSVELMLKTFLGLPERISGIKLTRKEFEEISESFPKLLDAIEAHAPEKIRGIDLGEIEWYHRLRNQLYHQGNGLTVESKNVEIYAQLANLLFENLFGEKLIPTLNINELLGDFLSEWVKVEAGLFEIADRHSLLGKPKGESLVGVLEFLRNADLLDKQTYNEINEIRRIRNEIIHSKKDIHQLLNNELIERLKLLSLLFGKEE